MSYFSYQDNIDDMAKKNKICDSFLGVTTLGEKGQVVVPAEARRALALEKGEKLLVFSFDERVLVMTKADSIGKLAMHLAEHLKDIKMIISKKDK